MQPITKPENIAVDNKFMRFEMTHPCGTVTRHSLDHGERHALTQAGAHKCQMCDNPKSISSPTSQDGPVAAADTLLTDLHNLYSLR